MVECAEQCVRAMLVAPFLSRGCGVVFGVVFDFLDLDRLGDYPHEAFLQHIEQVCLCGVIHTLFGVGK